jgi:ring-1,2-phenylacetyl-CoA epoxidase subunit PaaB
LIAGEAVTENDTQWPRYQVFLQEKTGAPHQDVGSVHAPDSELALQNARDVFVRRPECINLWVVPVDEIFSRTAQELASEGLVGDAVAPESGEAELFTYCVFAKKRSAGAQTFMGEVEAASPEQAMQRALEKFVDEKPPFAWWVFPKRCIVQSEQESIDSMFAPARHKSFRMSTDFHTLTEMRKILAQAKEGKEKRDGS